MTKSLFISLPVTDLAASTAFYKALGFSQNPQFSSEDGSAMVWSEAIQVILVTHAKWRTFTQRPLPPAGSCGLMLSLALESRDRKSTRLNSSHSQISYAVFCLKKKKTKHRIHYSSTRNTHTTAATPMPPPT